MIIFYLFFILIIALAMFHKTDLFILLATVDNYIFWGNLPVMSSLTSDYISRMRLLNF